MGKVHRLALRNDHAELPRMVAWADALIAQLALPDNAAMALHLCLEEAVCNVINHAFEDSAPHEIGIALWQEGEGLVLEVTDDGRAFDPLAHALPEAPPDLASAPIGGLGIKLMRHFAHPIEYRRQGAMNRLRLGIALAPGTAPAMLPG